MFSSNQLISYVFANPDDEYRGSDLMTLNLKQYLWQSLHRQYDTVYFLNGPEMNSFSVGTFGDKNAKHFKTGFWGRKIPISGSDVHTFGNWLIEQMTLPAKDAVAFVCPLDIFCQVLSDKAWRPYLEKLATSPSRTGTFVLTASPYAEDSQSYFMTSPVFDYLHETAVTESRWLKRCIYDSIRDEKPQNYKCLNVFTPERVSALLLHVCATDPDRCLGIQEREALARTLSAYLSDESLCSTLQIFSQPAMYMTYRDLYKQLLDRQVWNKILTLPQYSCVKTPSILRSPAHYAGKCMNLRLPHWAVNKEDSFHKYPKDILKEIQEIASRPPNRQENPELVEIACRSMDQLRDLEEGDIDTCSLHLSSLKICFQWITIREGDSHYEDVQDILQLCDIYAASSAELYRRERTMIAKQNDLALSNVERMFLAQNKQELDKDKQNLRNCVAYMRGNTMNMELSSTTGTVIRNLLLEAISKLPNGSQSIFQR